MLSGLTALTTLNLNGNALSSLDAGAFSGLTALEVLQLESNDLSLLPAGGFSGLTALQELYLYANELSSLPDGVFSGLTALAHLELDGNAVDPLPVAVSLEPAGPGRFNAVAPTAAPFALTLPISVVNGEIDGGDTTLTIPAGMVQSASVSVTRSAGLTSAVTADIGTLPDLPSGHQGYALEKSSGLPLEVLAEVRMLSGLTVSVGSTDLLTFASGTTTYTAMVANDVETVTFTATKNDDGASVTYLDSDGNTLDDADTTEDEFQVALAVGANAITVRVTAENGTTQDYTVTVTRAEGLPAVTVAAAAGGETVPEGTDAAFTLSRTGSTTAALTVAVAVSQTGSVLQDASAVPSSVTFAADAATAPLALETDDDDTDDDAGTVTLTLGAGTGYTVGEPGAATVAVSDNDVPVDFVLAVPATVAEDAGPATVTVTATTAENALPATLLEVHLARVSGTATGGSDYDAVSETVRFQVSDFAPATVDGQPRYRAEWTHDVVIHDDEEVEDDETVVLEMSPTSAFVLIHTLHGAHDAVRATLTIVDNDTAAVSFGAGSYSVDEGGTVAVTVQLDAAPGRQVVVPVSAAGAGGATPPGETGADWSGVPENVTFGATDTEQTFTLAATDDTDADPDESVTLSFGMLPDGVTAETPTEATVTIVDNDAANNAPSFTSSTTFTPVENQTTVGTVVASDDDASDDITDYEISGGTDQALFSIVSTSGVLTFQAAPNYEDPQDANTDNAYVVVVQATSGTGDREQTGTQTITVTVMDDDTEAPAAPDAPSVSPASATSLTVTWLAPDNDGPEITDYDVQYRAGTSAPWSDGSHIGTALTAILTGLLEDTSYQVQVRATNAEGTGGWSASGSGATDANAAPSFTSAATFNPAENQTAVGTVEAEDSDTTDDITDYALSGGADQALFSINNSGVLTFQAAPNYEDPQDANTDNAYLVVVQATSGTGDREQTGTQTITVTVMDDDTEAPAAPDAPSVSPASVTSLNVNWSAPDNAGPEITDYDVQYRAGTSEPWSDGSHIGTALTAILTGLLEDTSYQVQVRATNAEGTGGWSASGSGATDANAAPSFTSAATFNPAENQTAVGTVVASDATRATTSPTTRSAAARTRRCSLSSRRRAC